jgi:hypothetical protein
VQPWGGVDDGSVQPIVARVLDAAGVVPVVTVSTPESVVPLKLWLPPVPAALPIDILGVDPLPITCCT